MSPLEAEIVRRKLAVIVENLNALAPIGKMSKEEYLQDIYKRKAAERLLQELVEAAIDINTYCIVQTGHAAPDDYYESFIEAGTLNIISADLAVKLAPSAGLRNRLVHEYDDLDHSLVLDAITMAEELYPEYVREMENYLSRSR
ncbi:MAG: type VII toxin-antitoxin system HepT family RNase toxin [Nitrospirota bacterium]